ncbi:spore germination protein [Virgibacillus litoralis]|uniref:Spore germination protein KA n=1 Tax=Virgibacillus litoralis TaxID=578221 RepID=A0ABS4HCK6_9BACI|nr:spore germination protein [Virgibacillus litoralis]MBP1948636.1 spore germination protein KA [Virgibacillus litoralis]
MSKSFTGKKKNGEMTSETSSAPISSSLEKNVSILKEIFESCDDIIFQPTQIDNKSVCFVYLSEMVNNQVLYEIDRGLSHYSTDANRGFTSHIRQQFPLGTVNELSELQSVVRKILSGHTILIVDELDHIFSFHSTNSTGREVTEPTTESTVKGPKEGFVEDIHTNLRLIRRKLQTPSLKVEHLTLGQQTNTQVSIVYIKGVADDGIVNEVHQRLSRIDIDGVLDSHYIESMIKDSPKSPFPTIYSTERPDRVCGGLLDGKVGIITDGSPFALTAPSMFVEFLHSGEDYYDSSLASTIIRWVRFVGLFVTLILPSFYVGVTMFHQDLLQTPLLIQIAANREALPYPVLIEGLFMLLTFEFIREAGLRMPKVFGGGVVTILGLVLIGQSAVQAGIIGPLMAIVISVTALTSFILPNYEFHQVIRFCGIPLLLLTGFFGFMGTIVGLMFGLTHLVSLRSFGVPYFSPVSPARKEGWKDVFIRAPWWAMDTRTPGIGVENIDRAGKGNRARPPKASKEDQDEKK